MNPPCPFLPSIDRHQRASEVPAPAREERGADFYLDCLRCAQSLWQQELPAQALLQCNRALSLPISGDEPILREWPLPYQALAWMLLHRPAGQFIGNPRRHWQHLATRMVEPHKELRVWRAWACWYLAKTLLPEPDFPGNPKQIREELIIEPTFDQIFFHLGKVSPADDLAAWQHALQWARGHLPSPAVSASRTAVEIRLIGPEELPEVIALAHRIWHAHYPGIISQAQIDYMLGAFYTPERMRQDMAERGAVYALIEHGGESIGYIGFEPHAVEGVLFIGKLYLLPELHGRGIGRLALDWLQTQARERGCDRLRLRVNKHNAVAIRAYRRAGFQFVEDICTDIGGGFVMDDYIMEHAAAP